MIFLYGPPASGKSTIGQIIARQLNRPFIDLDQTIEQCAGISISEIFERQGEVGFRALEKKILMDLISNFDGVMALGGGALLDEENRTMVEGNGQVICLNAAVEILVERLSSSGTKRPLVNRDLLNLLPQLLEKRREHYASFSHQIDSSHSTAEELAWQAQILIGEFLVRGMGCDYEVKVTQHGLSTVGDSFRRQNLSGPIMVVSDENVASLYVQEVIANLRRFAKPVVLVTFCPGEENKTINTLEQIWHDFAQHGMERGGSVVALGGGVVSDLTGFAAGTYLRGVPWVILPTTLCAMVDAAIGGKTGIDLPQGKNLVGLFHAPRLVLSDPDTLKTLPKSEIRAGMAEVVKAGIIADKELFGLCQAGWRAIEIDWSAIISRAVAVKIKIIQADPYDHGLRAALNFGHTVGHALEKVSGFSLLHGLAVSMGMVGEARIAERLGLAQKGLVDEITEVLIRLGLPVLLPASLDPEQVYEAMFYDKKKSLGKLNFALPIQIGEVKVGVEVTDKHLIINALKASQS